MQQDSINRRNFILQSTVGAAALTGLSSCEPKKPEVAVSPLDTLTSLTKDIVPISIEERLSRIEKAQKLKYPKEKQRLQMF